jgi:hypothetical protein
MLIPQAIVQQGAVSDWTQIVKSADESTSADTTLTLDSELFFTAVSGATYSFVLEIVYASPVGAGTPDLKIAIGEDTVVRGIGVLLSLSAAGAAQVASILSDTDAGPTAVGTDTINRLIQIWGNHWGNGGTFGFLWSQNTSNPNDVIVRAGSILRYKRIT